MRSERLGKSIDARIHRWAASRYGIVTRGELMGLGCSESSIKRRVNADLLRRVRPGVLRVTSVEETWHQRMYALCRWLEPHVVASHRSAARLLSIGDIRTDVLEVTTRFAHRTPPGVVIHTTDHISSRDIRVRDLIPVTEATRTCIDCCAVLTSRAAQHVIDDACHHRLTTPERIMSRLGEMSAKGRNGVVLARKLVGQRLREAEMPESRLTRKLLRLIQESSLPNPVSLHAVRLPNGITIHPDLAYPAFMIAIEADGWKDHGRPDGWQRDRHRDNRHSDGSSCGSLGRTSPTDPPTLSRRSRKLFAAEASSSECLGHGVLVAIPCAWRRFSRPDALSSMTPLLFVHDAAPRGTGECNLSSDL